MTNREFYKDKLLDIVCAGDCFGVNKTNSQPVPCGELHCGKCVFSISDSCIKNRVAWCNKKYIKRLKLTENEKKFLDILNPDMKYIARDKDLRLFVFKEKPKKRGNTWGEIIAFDEYINEKHFKRMFEFIKWEDEEPWLIDDLRKLEVEELRKENPDWIPVSTGNFPKDKEPVQVTYLGYHDNKPYCNEFAYRCNGEWFWCTNDSISIVPITAWRPVGKAYEEN